MIQKRRTTDIHKISVVRLIIVYTDSLIHQLFYALPPRICHQYHQRNHSHIHSPKTHIAEVVCQTFPTNRF